MQEMLLEGDSDSRFTTGRETSKPQRKAFLATKGTALLVRDERRVPCYVANGFEALACIRDHGERWLRTPTSPL